MECPICFNEYDEIERRPIKTFCRCHQTLCYTCLETLTKYANHCPWDKTRWTGRNLLKRFEDATPENYLQMRKRLQQEEVFEQTNLLLCQNSSSSSSKPSSSSNMSPIGKDGSLQTVSVLSDDSYAASLQEEERRCYEEQMRIEREDFKLAKQLSLQLSKEADEQITESSNRKRSIADFIVSTASTSSSNKEEGKKPQPQSITDRLMHANALNTYSVKKKSRIEMYFQKQTGNPSIERKGDEDDGIKWICKYCTFENEDKAKRCEICGN